MTVFIFPLVLLVLVGGFTAVLWIGGGAEVRKDMAGKYDERQKLAQGRGFKWGFITACTVSVAIIFAGAFVERDILPVNEALMTAMLAGVTVTAVYCVSRDAYIPIGRSGVLELLIFGLYSVIAFLRGLDKLEERGAIVEGALGPCWVWFVMTFACASVCLSLVIKLLFDRRNKE